MTTIATGSSYDDRVMIVDAGSGTGSTISTIDKEEAMELIQCFYDPLDELLEAIRAVEEMRDTFICLKEIEQWRIKTETPYINRFHLSLKHSPIQRRQVLRCDRKGIGLKRRNIK